MVTVKRKVNNETERYGGYASTTLEVKEPGQSFNDAQVRDAETFNSYNKSKVAFARRIYA